MESAVQLDVPFKIDQNLEKLVRSTLIKVFKFL